jgi:hypothetical protein
VAEIDEPLTSKPHACSVDHIEMRNRIQYETAVCQHVYDNHEKIMFAPCCHAYPTFTLFGCEIAQRGCEPMLMFGSLLLPTINPRLVATQDQRETSANELALTAHCNASMKLRPSILHSPIVVAQRSII